MKCARSKISGHAIVAGLGALALLLLLSACRRAEGYSGASSGLDVQRPALAQMAWHASPAGAVKHSPFVGVPRPSPITEGALATLPGASATGTSASVVQVIVLGQAWFAVTSKGDLYASGYVGSVSPAMTPDLQGTAPRRVLTDVQSINSGDGYPHDIDWTDPYGASVGFPMALQTDGSVWQLPWYPDAYPLRLAEGYRELAGGIVLLVATKPDGSLWDFRTKAVPNGPYDLQLVDDSVQIMSDVASISASGAHALVVKTDGTLWSFGDNKYGQLGDGTTEPRETPVKVMSGVKSAQAVGDSSFAITLDGRRWGFGDNRLGQLLDGTRQSRLVPTRSMDGVSMIAVGNGGYLVVKTDGSLWASGKNDQGQLGDGTTIDRIALKNVMTGVKAAATGRTRTLVVKTDGTLWGFGANDSGELGDGTNVDRYSPVQIFLPEEE